jgi:lysophospholipase
MVNNLEHGYMPLPNYLEKTLSSVARFHDPYDPQGLQFRSRSNSADNLADQMKSASVSDSKTTLATSNHAPEDGLASPTFPRPKLNTVNTIMPTGPNANQKGSIELPSLITPVSLYGKRIRLDFYSFIFLAFSS